MTDSTIPAPTDARVTQRPRRVVQYQSFPDASGDSVSFDKLRALCMPVMGYKRFLDLGCNEGFFCGFALHDGAAQAVGIDASAEFIDRARLRFPTGTFLHQSWDTLPPGPFDVILLASALHYAADQPALIARAMGVLAPAGCLVLELGIAQDEGCRWIEVNRGIDRRLFPTRDQLAATLRPYAWKLIGPSVTQAGDPVPRFVVHVTHRKPLAWLLMQRPDPGFAKAVGRLFARADIPVVSGVDCLRRIASGAMDAPEALRQAVAAPVALERFVPAVRRAVAAGQLPALADAWVHAAGRGSFALEAYVPEAHRQEVVERLQADGYMVAVMTVPRAAAGPGSTEIPPDDPWQERAKPMAWLMMQRPGAGKTSIARALFNPARVAVVSGDACMQEVVLGKRSASPALTRLITPDASVERYDIAVRHVLREGLLADLVQVWLRKADGKPFALDAYIPETHHPDVERHVRAAGYRVMLLSMSGTGTTLEPLDKVNEVAESYFSELVRTAQERDAASPPVLEEPLPFEGIHRLIDSVLLDNGQIIVSGWAVNENGVPPRWIDLRIDGISVPFQHLRRFPRREVQALYKLSRDVGFRITAPAPAGLSPQGLADRVLVHCSTASERPASLTRRLSFDGTVGFLDDIAVDGQSIVVMGWAVYQDGSAAASLDLRIDGASTGYQHLRRHSRPDVQKRMNLAHAEIGFRITIPVPAGMGLHDLAHRVEMFGGPSSAALSGPFWSIPARRLPQSLPA